MRTEAISGEIHAAGRKPACHQHYTMLKENPVNGDYQVFCLKSHERSDWGARFTFNITG